MKKQFRSNLLMGQHFLENGRVVEAIINAYGGGTSDTVLEVGPGKGILTEALARISRRVVAVEKDPRLVARLGEIFRDQKNVEIVEGDILKINTKKLGLRARHYTIVANLPYYLTSRFLRRFLTEVPPPQRMVLMVQYEVAKRICAKPPKMSLLALSVQAYGKARFVKKVPRRYFRPEPHVDSAIIAIESISDAFFKKNEIQPKLFFAIAKRAFSQKRKTLKNSLGISSSVFGKKRPQELSLEEWCKVVKSLAP